MPRRDVYKESRVHVKRWIYKMMFPPRNVESKLTHMNSRMCKNGNLRQPLRMVKIKWKKERWILKSDNQLDSEYVTHLWMRASGSEHIKRIFSPMNVERIYKEDIKYDIFPDECRDDI